VADLVRRARDPRAAIQNRNAAFGILVERFEAMAFAMALRSCDDVETARDACQEAFLTAWRTLTVLREPAAFGGWLKRLVRTQCARAHRRGRQEGDSRRTIEAMESGTPGDLLSRTDAERRIRRAVDDLPHAEREAIVLFYFLGEPLRTLGRAMGVTAHSAGKTLYTARLHLRRRLPRSVVESFLAVGPAPGFTRDVQNGVFDELVGDYRFTGPRYHIVRVRREGNVLTGRAAGQRNVLASRRRDSLVATEYDGEARFQRDRHGRIRGFVYYEFGRRLGIARKITGRPSG
jgi:RNA polymerase sigma factor (sigma-70 family)